MRKSILPVESDSEGKGSGGRYDYGFEILQRKTLEIKGKISFRGQEREGWRRIGLCNVGCGFILKEMEWKLPVMSLGTM